jgi:glycosyltransferase involved in cell wall biosynthesis
LKIIHVLNHFLPYQTAGTEVYVWALCRELKSKGYDASVVIPNYNSGTSEEYTFDNLKVFRYAEPSVADRAIITGQRLTEGLKFFAEHIAIQQPDIIHFHEIAGSNGIGVAHFEAAKASGAKVFFTVHLASITCKTGTLMYAEEKLCDGYTDPSRCAYCALVSKTKSPLKAKLFSALGGVLYRLGYNTIGWQNAAGTALSYSFQVKKLKSDLKRIVAACHKIIPITNWYRNILVLNGVAENKLELVSQGLPVEPSLDLKPASTSVLPLKLIFIGRIDPLKGIPLLLEVAKGFAGSELQLDIYGAPSSAAFQEECLKQTKGFSHIHWKGKIDQQKVIQTMAAYDALILPSAFSEMSPLVIEEAKFAGLPVIGSDVYGIAEQVRDKVNGWLFAFKNRESLKTLIDQLIRQPSLIDEARKNISKTKNFTEIADAYINIYCS